MTDVAPPQCRICWEGGDGEGSKLVQPCVCRGSIRWIHEHCLEREREARNTCSICHTGFTHPRRLSSMLLSVPMQFDIVHWLLFHVIVWICPFFDFYWCPLATILMRLKWVCIAVGDRQVHPLTRYVHVALFSLMLAIDIVSLLVRLVLRLHIYVHYCKQTERPSDQCLDADWMSITMCDALFALPDWFAQWIAPELAYCSCFD